MEIESELLTLGPHIKDASAARSALGSIYDPLVAFNPQMRMNPAIARLPLIGGYPAMLSPANAQP